MEQLYMMLEQPIGFNGNGPPVIFMGPILQHQVAYYSGATTLPQPLKP
jgi:hypothetical protein